ncbi:MAG: hypothetical protein E7618_00455 [Ruminococcaceae bacterium]|nr:hypothetical protein [Oscillospiraceae bacterium]
MENKRDDISASELLAKLKANMAVEEEAKSEQPPTMKGKKYHFRRSGKTSSPITEEEIQREMPETGDDRLFVSPVPRSDIADLDFDELMRKYLPEDYEKLSAKKTVSVTSEEEDEDELVRTLTNLDAVTEEIHDSETASLEDEGVDNSHASTQPVLTAPDSELFDRLSAGGKVCDVPGDDTETDEMSDTRPAPLRPLSEEARTIAFGLHDDEEEGFLSVREILSAEKTEASTRPADDAPTTEILLADTQVLPTVEEETTETIPEEVEESTVTSMTDTVAFTQLSEEDAVSEDEETEQTEESDTQDEEESETVPEDDEFDETDANLMVAFGMDEELDAALGKESADKLRDNIDHMISEEEEKTPKKKREIPEEPIKEYISPSEAKGIMDRYRTAYGKNVLRLFGVIAIVVLLFFYENLGIFGGAPIDALNPAYYPVVHIMVGLQILLIGFALVAKSFLAGLRGLWNRKPIPESFLPLILLVTVGYSAAACYFTPGRDFVTFFFPVSLSLLFSVLNERLDLRREIMAFNIISSKRTKFALEKLDLGDAELETQAFDKFLPKQPSIFHINKTGFVDGYFRRTKQYPGIKLVLNAFLPATLVALVAGLLVGFVRLGSWEEAVQLAYTAFIFAVPAAVFFTFGLPAFRAEKLAQAEKSAFVGEAALDEYTTAASISFDDREVFPTAGVKLRSIKVFGSGRIDTVVYNVASVYALLGGPLADVLRVATADLGHSQNTDILAIENEGVEAVVDDQHLYIGKADYLRRHGYVPVADPDDEEIEGGGETSIMFLVCNDEVVAKLYVRYRIDPEFEITLKNLYRSGICVGIKTVDPNINDEMLSTRIRLSKYPVRVLKYSDVADTRRHNDRTDSGIVSKKSAKALLRTFTLCDKVKHVTKTNLMVNSITMIAGLVIALAVAFIGTVSGVYSVYVALFQLFWALVIYLLSKFMLM